MDHPPAHSYISPYRSDRLADAASRTPTRCALGLSGTLSTFPLSELLQWLGASGKTGTLKVQGDRYTKTVFLKEGRIISSASDDPTEQLGQFLLSHGRITEDDLRKGLETQARSKALLGRILTMTGRIGEEELKELLVQKAEETIFGLFLLSDATFEFVDGELPKSFFVPIALDVQEVLLKGVAVLDELRHMRRAFGSSGSILARTDKKLSRELPGEKSIERRLLALVDGKRSITDLCLAVHASEFTAGKMLLQFLDMGLLRVSRRVDQQPMRSAAPADRPFISHDALVEHARERLAANDSEQAVELLRQAMAAAPREYWIKKLHDEAAAVFRKEAHARWLPPTGILHLRRSLTDLGPEKLTPEEGFLLSRINGSWDVKSIIDISPLAEVDVLRLLKGLLDRGFIDVR